MNNRLFDFYLGSATGPRNLTLDEILLLTNGQFEQSHDLIQWIFPLPEPSKHNKAAPLLDDETIVAMKENEVCRANLKRCFLRFEKFLNETKEVWVAPKNHNLLRITRAIRCLMLLNEPILARCIHAIGLREYINHPEIIGETALKYWEQALNLEIPGDSVGPEKKVWVVISGVDFEDCRGIQKISCSKQAALAYVNDFVNSMPGWERNSYNRDYEWCKGSDYIIIEQHLLENE